MKATFITRSGIAIGVALTVAATLLFARRRRGETDTRLALKRHSQSNRAYRFSLPPIERPK